MGSITIWHWLGFGLLVALLLAADLGLFHRKAQAISLRSAAITTVCWCLLAMAFNVYVWLFLGDERTSGAAKAINFLTGYITEWSLSMDNVFVFAVVFRYFHVPPKYQHRVLFWGILGAVFMRLAFVLAGAALIHHFHFTLVIFGVFLLYTGIKLAAGDEGEIHPERTFVLRFARKYLRVAGGHYETHAPPPVPERVLAAPASAAAGATLPGEEGIVPEEEPSPEEMEAAITVAGSEQEIDDAHLQADLEHPATGDRFLVRHQGKLCVTPLFLVLLVVETTDVLFAVDSVPAIFGITKDPFIVFTSNIFAILGLRALYFLLAGVMDLFHYLKYGLAMILVFIGVKMIAEYVAEYVADTYYGLKEFHLIPVWASLAVIGLILAIAVGASLVAKQRAGRVQSTRAEASAGASHLGE